MMKRINLNCLPIIFLVFSFVHLTDLYGQLKMDTPFPVQVYHGNKLTSIVYELHLIDSLKRPVKFISFTIGAGDKVLLQDADYEKLPKKTDTNRYVKYIWINVDKVPQILTHKIIYKIDDKIYSFSKEVKVNDVPPVIIGLPVKKGIWYMEDGPSPVNDHRKSTTATKSQYDSIQDGYKLGYNNQRFAIDFDKMGDDGLICKNDGKQNTDYYTYQQDVIAVADGIVIGVKDSIPDMPNPPKIEKFKKNSDFTGNLVLLDIGNGIVASYAHLLAFSIKVHVGDTLKKGDFIGKIGNSGNSTGPHLHFHLSKPDFSKLEKTDLMGIFIASEGMSFVFDNYTVYHVVSGKFADNGEMKDEPFIFDQPVNVKNTMPYNKDFIGVEK